MNLLELLGFSAANAMPINFSEKKAKQNTEKLLALDWFRMLYENEEYKELFNHSEVIMVILASVDATEIINNKETGEGFRRLLGNKLKEQKNTPV
ncbi:hypothetical protein M3204_19300 [Mesobacillus subterraneus]|uniref:hypothetical protein n=1 Tax=Mesobacillus subterraneus TaxID=285983 RepID=UPI00203D645D|nr:hypothetical protein [Mesobacillus subterraneus]MCM3666571.1 hypothetical protein [Mesobacillus subterraneus]MCM3685939.1 hypothetical protein [Mesobacillus subterraneus]